MAMRRSLLERKRCLSSWGWTVAARVNATAVHVRAYIPGMPVYIPCRYRYIVGKTCGTLEFYHDGEEPRVALELCAATSKEFYRVLRLFLND